MTELEPEPAPEPAANTPSMVRVVFYGQRPTTDAAADTLRSVDELWCVAYELAAYLLDPDAAPHHDRPVSMTEHLAQVPRPASVRVSMQSPMWIEMVTGTVGDVAPFALAAGILRYLVRNPSEVAGFFPKLVESWHAGWSAAERAQRERRLGQVRVPRHARSLSAHPGRRVPPPLDPEAARQLHPAHVELVERARTAVAVLDAGPGNIRVEAEGPGSDWEPPA